MGDDGRRKSHVFVDEDAEVIHEGLMIIVSSLTDLKDILTIIDRKLTNTQRVLNALTKAPDA